MFRAFRIRLITVTMLAISVIVFAIVGAINVSNAARLRRYADNMLSLISDYNGTIPENTSEIAEDRVDLFIRRETPFQTR